MSDKGNISHLPQREMSSDPEEALADRIAEKLDMRLAKHFQEQNKQLHTAIERLLGEVDGVRNGTKEDAFARVAPANIGAECNLPSIQTDVALHYPHTGESIGSLLGLTPAEVGTLLGHKGLNWADDPDYQEMTRFRLGRTRFWHMSVPEKLKAALENPSQEQIFGAHKRIKAIVRKYRRNNNLAEVVAGPAPLPNDQRGRHRPGAGLQMRP